MTPEEKEKQQWQNGIQYLLQDKEVNRIEDVTVLICEWKKKRHSWFYLLKFSQVSVKAQKGTEEQGQERRAAQGAEDEW